MILKLQSCGQSDVMQHPLDSFYRKIEWSPLVILWCGIDIDISIGPPFLPFYYTIVYYTILPVMTPQLPGYSGYTDYIHNTEYTDYIHNKEYTDYLHNTEYTDYIHNKEYTYYLHNTEYTDYIH